MPAKGTSKSRAKKARAATTRAGKTAASVGRKATGARQRRLDFNAQQFLTSMGAGRSTADYRARKFIFRQGAKCDAVYYVVAGQIELNVVSQGGKERVVGMLGPGAFIGEGCLAGHPLYLVSARALTDATVVRIEAQTMMQAIREHPEMSQMFMDFLLQRNSQIESDLVDQLFNSSEKRLARLLIMLAQVGNEAKMQKVVAPISQEVMAARVGTTRSRINYFMNKFRKLGLIEYNGELKVHSSLMNVIVRD
jgi:CRP/FNR family cyclic AMP-dependent transcriptional regulator